MARKHFTGNSPGTDTTIGGNDFNILNDYFEDIDMSPGAGYLHGDYPARIATATWVRDNRWKFWNPTSTYAITIRTSPFTTNQNLYLPALTSDDTLVGITTTGQLYNKTLYLSDNTLSDSTISIGDLMKSNGVKYERWAKGLAGQVPMVNTLGTDLIWSNIDTSVVGSAALILSTDVPNSSTLGNSYFSISGDASANSTFNNRRTKLGYDITVTAVRANVMTNTLNQASVAGIATSGGMVASVTIPATTTGYREAVIDPPVVISANTEFAILFNTQTAASGSYEIRPISIECVTPFGAASGTTGGGGGPVIPDDNSVSTAKIVDSAVTGAKIASTTIGTGNIIDSAITTIKINNLAVTSGKLANDAVTATQLASNAVTTAKILDSNVTNAKLAGSISNDKLLQITDKTKLPSDVVYTAGGNFVPTQATNKYGGYTLTTATGGSGIFNGFLTQVNTGSFSIQMASDSGCRARFTTGTTNDNQQGIRTTDVFTRRSNNPKLYFKVTPASTGNTNNLRAIIGFMSGSLGFPSSSDPLNARHAFTMLIDQGNSNNYRVGRNDGTGATVQTDLSPATAFANHTDTFIISCDNAAGSWTINMNGTNNTYTTEIPDADTNLFMVCFIQTNDTNAKSLDVRHLEFFGSAA